MNNFGGNWTKYKIEILVEYARAYLTIMNSYADKYNWKLLYYDGFAGSGLILKEDNNNDDAIIGAARRIIEINDPRPFDEYYFVEKDEDNFSNLELHTKKAFPHKVIHTVMEDCNNKLKSMSDFLRRKGNKHKVLAYIDPCGMQVKWQSLEMLQDLPIDMWILIPTGMGVNRLLTKDGKISAAWVNKLEEFLGLSEKEILSYFYTKTPVLTLFGEEVIINKEANAVEKSVKLYKERLNKLFKFVSEPYPLKNSLNNTLYHFIMVSNNKYAVEIADDIVNKYKKLN